MDIHWSNSVKSYYYLYIGIRYAGRVFINPVTKEIQVNLPGQKLLQTQCATLEEAKATLLAMVQLS